MQKRLGKGLDSLLPGSLNENTVKELPGIKVYELDISKVKPNPDQPRKDFDQAALEELSASIAEKGVIQPILVQENNSGEYIIIAGERRYRASLLAGAKTIPGILKSYDSEETLEIALIENLQREDLNPLEEALAFQNLLDQYKLTQESLSVKLGKSRSSIANSLRLLKLHPDIQISLRSNKLTAGHARALLSFNGNPEKQLAFSQAIIESDFSVREAESLSKLLNTGLELTEACAQIRQPQANNIDDTLEPVSRESYKDAEAIKELSRGATVTYEQDKASESTRRSPELWDMEEKLIVSLGTKVQIKGNTENGKIELSYYSLEDLGRLFDLLTKGRL